MSKQCLEIKTRVACIHVFLVVYLFSTNWKKQHARMGLSKTQNRMIAKEECNFRSLKHSRVFVFPNYTSKYMLLFVNNIHEKFIEANSCSLQCTKHHVK